MNKKEVIVYSTPTCPYCVYAKNYFRENGVEFKDIDVSRDRSAAIEMVQKSGQMGVPVIDIGGEITVGFRPDVFAQQLGI
jgi:glutaredoxin-like YruB-family protein